MQIHAERVAGRHDPTDCRTVSRTGGAEQIDPLVFGLPPASRPAAALRPHVRQRALLAEAAFVFEPDFDSFARVFFADFRERPWEVFLKASWTAGSDLVCC